MNDKDKIIEDLRMHITNLFMYKNNAEYIQDRDICLAGVDGDGLALKDVPENLRDEEMCSLAVMRHAGAIAFVPENIKTKEFCMEYAKHSSLMPLENFRHIPKKLENYQEIVDIIKEKYREVYDNLALFSAGYAKGAELRNEYRSKLREILVYATDDPKARIDSLDFGFNFGFGFDSKITTTTKRDRNDDDDGSLGF